MGHCHDTLIQKAIENTAEIHFKERVTADQEIFVVVLTNAILRHVVDLVLGHVLLYEELSAEWLP